MLLNGIPVIQCGVNTKVIEDGGGKVSGCDGVIANLTCMTIRRAEDLSAFDTATSKEHGEGMRPMISASGFGHRILGELPDAGCASEFTGSRDKGGIEKPMVVEIEEEGREGLVEDWKHTVFESGEDVIVLIPVRRDFVIERFVVPIDGHQGYSGLNESAGGQKAAAEDRAAVAIEDMGWFGFEINCFADFSGFKHREGGLLMAFEALSGSRFVVEGGILGPSGIIVGRG